MIERIFELQIYFLKIYLKLGYNDWSNNKFNSLIGYYLILNLTKDKFIREPTAFLLFFDILSILIENGKFYKWNKMK